MAYNPWQALAGNVSSAGSFLGVPNMGISGTIAYQDPTRVVQPSFGMQPMPSYSAMAASPTSNNNNQGYVQYNQPIGPVQTQNNNNNGNIINNPTPQPTQPSPEELARQRWENEQRGYINSGWDSYTNSLNDMLNVGLPGQQQAQRGIAETSYNQGINTLGSQKNASEQAVQVQQSKNLKDLSANVRNLFQAGNVYLGSRGAGDSSAANQYSYAIGKIGTRARGDIMGQSTSRLGQIGDIYNQESGRLKSDYDSRLYSISDWFNNAQNQVRQSLGQAGISRNKDLQALSQSIYNQAISAMQTLQQQTNAQKSALESWAMYNSQNVGQLTQNMQAIQQMPQFQGLNTGTPQVSSEGNYTLPATGYGSTNTQKRDLFGNVIG